MLQVILIYFFFGDFSGESVLSSARLSINFFKFLTDVQLNLVIWLVTLSSFVGSKLYDPAGPPPNTFMSRRTNEMVT